MIWIDEYATGVESVDRQHKTIFKTVADYRVALEEGGGKRTFGLLLDFLGNYIRTHFDDEQGCMLKFGCSAAGQNQIEHAEFTEIFKGFKRRYGAKGYTDSLAHEVIDTVGSWFANHICRVDTQLKKAVAPSPE